MELHLQKGILSFEFALMMSADDVIEVLERLEAAGAEVWLDGGWGIDALLGCQARPHDDLDACIARENVPVARTALERLGFRHAQDVQPGLPARLVLRDSRGRQIDFHPIIRDGSGDGWQELGDGKWGHYPAEGLKGMGSIAGRPVRCITPELQLQHHLGYEPSSKDRHDLALLARRFNLTLPPPYADLEGV